MSWKHVLKITSVFALLLVWTIMAGIDQAQPPWGPTNPGKTYGGTRIDRAWAVQQTTDGGYILAGLTQSYGAGGQDAWLIKTDANGDTCDYTANGNCYENASKWVKTFGGTGWDEGTSVQETTDGGYILTGHTDSYGAGLSDAWLIKTNANGTKVWSKTFGGTNDDGARSVKQTTDGGYILAASTYSYGAGDIDFWLIKTNANGTKLWDKTFGGTFFDEPWAVQQTTDGGYMLAGGTSLSNDNCHFWLIKTDVNGNKVWDQILGTPPNPDYSSYFARSAQQTTDGGYVLAGSTYISYRSWYDACLIKTNANGDRVWEKTFGGAASGYPNDIAYSVQQTTDGGYILAGCTDSFGAGEDDFWLIKTNANGNAPAWPGE